jgi:putative transposase
VTPLPNWPSAVEIRTAAQSRASALGSSRRTSAGSDLLIVALYSELLYDRGMSQYTIHYKSNHNVVYSCKYHVVWCPKYRRAVLVNGVDVRLKTIIQDICNESMAELLQLEVMPDHVQLVVEVDPQYGIHRLVRSIKGRSSRLLRQEYPWLKSRLPTLWTNAYFVSTTGSAPLEVITQYIEHQKRV